MNDDDEAKEKQNKYKKSMGKERKAHEPKHTTSSLKHDGASVMASGTGQQLLINDFLSEF